MRFVFLFQAKFITMMMTRACILPTRGVLSSIHAHRIQNYTIQKTNGTHFGFQNVHEHEKEKLVGDVFKKVATNYDLMNDAMSLGVHRCWKDTLIRTLDPKPDTQLLDVAGGTGDIAFRFVKRVSKIKQDSTARVKVIDINPSMLEVGIARSKSHLSLAEQRLITWEEGNAEDLVHVSSQSMDAYTIAFGIRNCTHIDRVLQESFRVLKRGGRFLCLEFSHVENPLLKRLYDVYSFQVIPVMGEIISNNKSAYQYLVESIRKFPNQTEFALMIQKAGFRQVETRNLFAGIAAIHSGIKL